MSNSNLQPVIYFQLGQPGPGLQTISLPSGITLTPGTVLTLHNGQVLRIEQTDAAAAAPGPVQARAVNEVSRSVYNIWMRPFHTFLYYSIITLLHTVNPPKIGTYFLQS